jgi:hypothetical protein
MMYAGAGEGFTRWLFEQKNGRRKKSSSSVDPPELASAIEEQYSRLNMVAMLFLKRSFKHVRY